MRSALTIFILFATFALASPATAQLQTESSDRGQVISGQMTRALPLNGREYSQLALLSPGVRLSSLNTGGSTPREGSFNLNGLRSTFNNFLIDGVDNNAYGTSNQGFSNQVMQPSPDAVAEFKVVTNNMSAEYGRSAGATINVAYASGTNRFSGAAWDFIRRTDFNSTGFFKPADGQKPRFDRDQFGGVLGGPLLRNRAFFFMDTELFRQEREQPAASTIATLAQRQGVLSVDVRHPLTGVLYPAGTPLPMTPFASEVLTELPAPTTSGTANNYVLSQLFQNNTNKAGDKVDVVVGPRLSTFARVAWRDVDVNDAPPIPLPSGGAGNASTYVENKQVATGFTYIPSTTSLFEVRFGWSQTQAGKNPAALGSTPALDAYGITGLPTDSRVAGGLPTQLVTGYSDLGRQATNPQWQYPTVYDPKINYSRVNGRHSVKGGYEFQRILTEVQDVNPLYGRDQYAGQFTRPAGAAASNLYNLADFMFGLRSTYALSNILVAKLQQDMHFGYVQDDWRVNEPLTVNLGLRYEFATPWVEEDNILSNFDPATRTMVMARDGSLRDRSTLMSSVTLSQTKDNGGAGSLENPNGNFPAPQDFYNLDADFGLSAHHQPYKERATLVYTAGPAFQVSGIQQDFRGANNYRPNVTGEVLVPEGSRTPQSDLNRDTVLLPTDPSQLFGNAERNSVSAQLYWTLDLQATKRVPMPWPQGAVEFRIEAFNLFNRTNFRAPVTNRSANNFGTITASYDARVMQIGVRVLF